MGQCSCWQRQAFNASWFVAFERILVLRHDNAYADVVSRLVALVVRELAFPSASRLREARIRW